MEAVRLASLHRWASDSLFPDADPDESGIFLISAVVENCIGLASSGGEPAQQRGLAAKFYSTHTFRPRMKSAARCAWAAA